MREILFRGKRLSDGEWVYGSLFVDDKSEKYEILIGFVNYRISWEVDPETVGQYTGLTDKNGNKIFDGDVVLTQEYYDKPYAKNRKAKRHTGVVEYKICGGNGFYNPDSEKWDKRKEYAAKWVVKVKDYGKFVHGSWGDFFDCEVIGNIHDNPELLEV